MSLFADMMEETGKLRREAAESDRLLRSLLAAVFRDGRRTATFPTMCAAVNEAVRIVADGHAAREQVEQWQDASGLECGGDPGGVTPDMLANHLLERDRHERALLARIEDKS